MTTDSVANRGILDKNGDFENQVLRLTDIGIALSAEHDLEALLDKTLRYARELTRADAGTLYLLRDNLLHFEILHNETLGVFRGGVSGEPVGLDPVELDRANVSACAALLGRTIRIDDVYRDAEFDFSGPRRYDRKTGYRSKSMLVVPMRNHEGEVIGVLQLINAVDPATGALAGFGEEAANLAEALASQAAVAIENARLIRDVQDLFESLIRVLAGAIDMKSTYMGAHVQRVAEFNVALARAVNAKTDGPLADVTFTPRQLEAMRVAGWLHDVGKITTPVWIMDKATKLEGLMDGVETIRERFGVIRQGLRLEALEAKLALGDEPGREAAVAEIDAQLARRLRRVDEDFALVERCDSPRESLDDRDIERLREIAAKEFRDADGRRRPYLEAGEVEKLSVRRGSLTAGEMATMRGHALMTRRMLNQVAFDERLSDVPAFASQHHEKLNGQGYPDGLRGEEIPLASRILAVADLYEALSARDRPYKAPMPEAEALALLRESAERGEIDADVVRLLTEDKVHRAFEAAYEKEKTRTEGGSLSVGKHF